MPAFLITCRGGLRSKAGLLPTGSTVEMSEKDAASLPVGTVVAVAVAVAVAVPVAPVVPIAAKPAPKPSHVAVKAKDSKS